MYCISEGMVRLYGPILTCAAAIGSVVIGITIAVATASTSVIISPVTAVGTLAIVLRTVIVKRSATAIENARSLFVPCVSCCFLPHDAAIVGPSVDSKLDAARESSFSFPFFSYGYPSRACYDTP